MKKALLALAVAAFASAASAQIANSKHDLTLGVDGNVANPQYGSCQFCHAPHYGNVQTVNGGPAAEGYAQIPLWNRRTPVTTGYSLHTTAITATPVLGVGSFTCLSCHDGVADLGQTYRGATRGFVNPTVLIPAGPNNIGGTWDGAAWVAPALGATDLRDDHPVGVPYTPSSEYKAVAAVQVNLKLYTSGGNPTVECGTCHDPHLSANTKFLRFNGNLCAECHSK